MLKPDFLLHIKNICGVVSLDSSGKQTHTTCGLCCSESSWPINFYIPYFLFLSVCSGIRKTLSKIVKLKCMTQMMMDEWVLIRPGLVGVQLVFCLVFQQDRGRRRGMRVSVLEGLTKRRATVVAQGMQGEGNQIPACFILKEQLRFSSSF